MKRIVAALCALGTMALSPVTPPGVTIELSAPTDRYAHGVLGDAIEWGALQGRNPDGHVVFELRLPDDRVFEDIEARHTALDTDLHNKVVVVESQRRLGAQLSVYEFDDQSIKKRAATPHIGRANRWLAPAAIADFDGDGLNDIAYVETPHLAGILKIVTLKGDALVPVVEPQAGFSNHRIGQDFITSDTRVCDGVLELLLPDLAWRKLLAVRIESGRILSRSLPYPPSREGIEQAQADCQP